MVKARAVRLPSIRWSQVWTVLRIALQVIGMFSLVFLIVGLCNTDFKQGLAYPVGETQRLDQTYASQMYTQIQEVDNDTVAVRKADIAAQQGNLATVQYQDIIQNAQTDLQNRYDTLSALTPPAKYAHFHAEFLKAMETQLGALNAVLNYLQTNNQNDLKQYDSETTSYMDEYQLSVQYFTNLSGLQFK